MYITTFVSEFLVEDLITHSQDGNQKKYMGICKLPQRDKVSIG